MKHCYMVTVARHDHEWSASQMVVAESDSAARDAAMRRLAERFPEFRPHGIHGYMVITCEIPLLQLLSLATELVA